MDCSQSTAVQSLVATAVASNFPLRPQDVRSEKMRFHLQKTDRNFGKPPTLTLIK